MLVSFYVNLMQAKGEGNLNEEYNSIRLGSTQAYKEFS